MNRVAGRSPRRLEVVRRNDHYNFQSHMGSDEHGGWAVSYSDFLMVLLSFFVIFFSINNHKDRRSMIFKIMSQVKGNPQEGGQGTGPGRPDGREFTSQDAETLAGLFKSLSPKVGENPASLTLVFPDNVFKPGEYKLTGSALNEYEQLIKKLMPYQEQIQVVITGHSDSTGVIATQGRKFEDNFELSSLRASAAIRNALNVGFVENHIRARAASHNERNTRSISITIQDIRSEDN